MSQTNTAGESTASTLQIATSSDDDGGHVEEEEHVENYQYVTLISSDERQFKLSRTAAELSNFVKDTLSLDDEDDDDDDDDDDEKIKTYPPVNVLRVKGDVLEKVVDFLQYYEKHPMPEIDLPLQGNSIAEIIPDEWYELYFRPENMNKTMIFEVLAAANYMTIKPLLDLACLWCTFEITGKSHEEIRELLNIPEMTAEEEARAREEHPWIFEDIQP